MSVKMNEIQTCIGGSSFGSGRVWSSAEVGGYWARQAAYLPCGCTSRSDSQPELKWLANWLSFLSGSESAWRVVDLHGRSLYDSLSPCGVTAATHGHSLLQSNVILPSVSDSALSAVTVLCRTREFSAVSISLCGKRLLELLLPMSWPPVPGSQTVTDQTKVILSFGCSIVAVAKHDPWSLTYVRVTRDSDPSGTDGYGRRAVDRLWRRWRQHGWTCPQLTTFFPRRTKDARPTTDGDLETQRHEKVNAWICTRPTTHHDLASEKRKRKKGEGVELKMKMPLSLRREREERETSEMIDRHDKRDRHENFFSKNYFLQKLLLNQFTCTLVIIFGRMFIEERFLQVVGQICRLVSYRFRRSEATRHLWVHFTPNSTNAHLLVDRKRLLDSRSQYEHTLKAHNLSVWKDCLSVPCLILFLSANTKPRRHLFSSVNEACLTIIACMHTKLWHAYSATFFASMTTLSAPSALHAEASGFCIKSWWIMFCQVPELGVNKTSLEDHFLVSFEVGILHVLLLRKSTPCFYFFVFLWEMYEPLVVWGVASGVAEGCEVRLCLLLCVSVSVPVCSSVFPSVGLCLSSTSLVPKKTIRWRDWLKWLIC